MLETLFPMATGTHTHTSDNRLLVEEQEKSSHSEWLGDFQHIALKRVRVCALRHQPSCSNLSGTQTRTQTHKQVQICGYLPQWLLSLGVYTLVSLISK